MRLADDAALLRPAPGRELVLTKDLLVAGVHFFGSDPPDAIARKALRVNLSDLAAKAARPEGFLLGLALPPDWTTDWLEGFAAGLGKDAAGFECPLLGGDTVRTPGPLTLSITAIGSVASGRMISRGNINTGDNIYVTGTIGDAALGLRLRQGAAGDQDWIQALREADADFLRDRYLLPRPRLALREPISAFAHAAMDVSDGLAGDLAKMLRLSGMTVEIRLVALPLSQAARGALAAAPSLIDAVSGGGDDYEILCAVPPGHAAAFESAARSASVTVTLLGQARPGQGGPVFLDAQGKIVCFSQASFQHFHGTV